MSVQDDKAAGQDDERQAKDHDDDRQAKDEDQDEDNRPRTEKPEPDEEDRKKAAEMMTAYEDRPTLVLPGSGGMVSGTAVNDWLDDEGNPRHEVPDEAGSEDKAGEKAQKGEAEGDDEGRDEEARKEQIEKDKALNEELKKASAAENKGEKAKS